MLWPTVTLVGWLAMAALVIALGRGSTIRYEVERGSIRQPAATSAAPGAGGAPGPDRQPAAAGGEDAAERQARATAVATASHPAGKRAQGGTSQWWLVDGVDGEQLVAGPFASRFEAEWAALADGHPASTRPAHGVEGPGGGLLRRQTPGERAWYAELGDHLDRLPDEWDGLLTEEDALTTLVVEVAAALIEAGLPLHDGSEREPGGEGPAGGVCLTPDPGCDGVLVAWRQHDRMDVLGVRGTAAGTAVRRTMTAAVAEVLRELGFQVEPIGPWGCCRVTAPAQA